MPSLLKHTDVQINNKVNLVLIKAQSSKFEVFLKEFQSKCSKLIN